MFSFSTILIITNSHFHRLFEAILNIVFHKHVFGLWQTVDWSFYMLLYNGNSEKSKLLYLNRSYRCIVFYENTQWFPQLHVTALLIILTTPYHINSWLCLGQEEASHLFAWKHWKPFQLWSGCIERLVSTTCSSAHIQILWQWFCIPALHVDLLSAKYLGIMVSVNQNNINELLFFLLWSHFYNLC